MRKNGQCEELRFIVHLIGFIYTIEIILFAFLLIRSLVKLKHNKQTTEKCV